ncbi:unnamed protein product, partial [marine sediment metagenome]
CELMKRNESLREIHVVLIGAIHDEHRYRRPASEIYGADAYVERPQLPEALRPILRNFGIGGAAAAVAAAPVEELAAADSLASAASAPNGEPVPVTAPAVSREPIPIAPPPPEASMPEVDAPIVEATTAVESAPTLELPIEPRLEPVSEPPAVAATPNLDPAQSEAISRAERLARIIVADIVLYNQEKFEAAIASGNVLQGMESEMAEGRDHFDRRTEAALREARDFLADELLR